LGGFTVYGTPAEAATQTGCQCRWVLANGSALSEQRRVELVAQAAARRPLPPQPPSSPSLAKLSLGRSVAGLKSISPGKPVSLRKSAAGQRRP